MSDKTIIAIAIGDPAGIGPEISLKAALDPAVRNGCNPLMVGDAGVLERHAAACRIAADLRVVARPEDADWSGQSLNVLDCAQPDLAALDLGATSAASGRAALAFARTAIKTALAGEVDAVVAAPQNETSIALAGIKFDGYPSFVARETGTDEDDVYLMLCFDDVKIVHATLHRSVRQAIEAITQDRITRVIAATDRTLRRMGMATPKIAVGGLNPHAGEGGLFRAGGHRDHQAGDRGRGGARSCGHRAVRCRYSVSQARVRCLHRHAARPRAHRGQTLGAERGCRVDHRQPDPVLLGCARQRP